MTWKLSWTLLGLLAILTTGCPDALQDVLSDDSGEAYPAGVDDRYFYYEYWPGNPEMIDPRVDAASLWALDLATGETRRLEKPRPRIGLQAYGDYFVYEQQVGDTSFGQIVAVQISTRQRTTISEYDSGWPAIGNPHPIHILDGDRVMVRTQEGLMLFDLAEGAAMWTFDLQQDDELIAFKGNQVLVARYEDEESDYWPGGALAGLLIDVLTDEATQIAPPDGIELWSDAQLYGTVNGTHISDTWILTTGYESFDPVDEEAPLRAYVLAYHIPTGTWDILAEGQIDVGPDLTRMQGIMPFVCGLGDSHAVLSFSEFDMLPTSHRLELIDLESHDRRLIEEHSGISLLLSTLPTPLLHSQTAYWIDYLSKSLVLYDIESGQRRTLQLGGPFDD